MSAWLKGLRLSEQGLIWVSIQIFNLWQGTDFIKAVLHSVYYFVSKISVLLSKLFQTILALSCQQRLQNVMTTCGHREAVCSALSGATKLTGESGSCWGAWGPWFQVVRVEIPSLKLVFLRWHICILYKFVIEYTVYVCICMYLKVYADWCPFSFVLCRFPKKEGTQRV